MFGLQDVETGEYFDTKDITISYVIKGPVFRGEDKVDGSLVFNTELPATDKNKKLLKFPGRIEQYESRFDTSAPPAGGSTALRDDISEVAVYGWLNGMQIWTGTMVAKFARPGGIEVSIGMGRGEFNYEADGMLIADVVPEEIHNVGKEYKTEPPVSQIPHWVHDIDLDDVVTKTYPEINFAVFPVKIEDMCSLLGSAFNNAYYNTTPCVNTWDMKAQKFMHPVLFSEFFALIKAENDPNTNTNLLGYLLAYNIFMPFPYNSWVFKNLFQTMGFFLENNPFEKDEDLKRLVLFNVQTINKMWSEYAHYTGNPNTDRYLYALEPEMEFNLKDHLPAIAVKDYLRGLEDMFFFRCFINNKTKRVKVKFLKDVINSRKYADITHKVSVIKERRMEFDRISALVQTYDPADGKGGVLKAVSEVQALDRIPDVQFKDGLPVNDQGQYTNKICYATMEKKWYICPGYSDDFTRESTWEEFNYEYYLQMYTNKTGKEWKADASGIICTYFTDYKPGTATRKYEWMLPYCKMPLKFYNSEKTKDAACSLRFLFYRGLVDGKEQIVTTPGYWVVLGTDSNGHSLYEIASSWLQMTAGLSFTVRQELLAHFAYFSAGDYVSIPMLWDDAQSLVWSYLNNITLFDTFFQNFMYKYWDAGGTMISVTNHKYPYGTNDVYDAFGVKMPEANLSTKWEGECGIYNKLAKDFVEWYNNRAKAVTIVFQPEAADLFLDFSMKQRVRGIDYLFDEIRGEILADGTLGTAEADAYSC